MRTSLNLVKVFCASTLIGGAALCGCNNSKKPIEAKVDTFEYTMPVEIPKTYPIKTTEDINKLAERFNTDVETFKEYANINGTKINYKDTIKVPNVEIKTTFYAIAKKYNVSVDYLQYVLNPQIYDAERIKRGTLINVPFKPFEEKQTMEKLFPNYTKSMKKIFNSEGDIVIKNKTFPSEINGIKFLEFMRSNSAMEKDFGNIPDVKSMKNLESLIENVVMPIKEHYGRRIEITSGYRGPKLNQLVGGVSNSQHAIGEAFDFKIKGEENEKVYEWCKKNLKYDQLILEYGDWIHISYKNKGKNRQRAFIKE